MKPNEIGGQILEGKREINTAIAALRSDGQPEIAASLEANISTKANQVIDDLLVRSTITGSTASIGMYDTLISRYNRKTDVLSLTGDQTRLVLNSLEKVAAGEIRTKRRTARMARSMVAEFKEQSE